MSYTLRYGKTYDEWIHEKALRIRGYLAYVYGKMPIDLQQLAWAVYHERLVGVGKWWWKPVKDAFTDFKPSPFIKYFIYYLIDRLRELGYLDETNMVVSIPPLDMVVDICAWKLNP